MVLLLFLFILRHSRVISGVFGFNYHVRNAGYFFGARAYDFGAQQGRKLIFPTNYNDGRNVSPPQTVIAMTMKNNLGNPDPELRGEGQIWLFQIVKRWVREPRVFLLSSVLIKAVFSSRKFSPLDIY